MNPGQPSTVQFNDVSASYAELRQQIDAAIHEVLHQGDFINGRAITHFEKEFATYTGSAACAACANGTAALELALRAADIKPGDEIITTPMTFIATSEAITLAGATPIFADISPQTLNLDPDAAEAAITPRTRAILFVHLHGNPGGATECADIARRHNLLFIEDCAQAHGARLPGSTHVGNLGTAAAYSFFPAKNLGAFGDAGAICSNNPQIAARAKRLANHGRQDKYVHLEEGTNARMDTLQAAILRVKLTTLDRHVQQRNQIASLYANALKDLPLRLQPAPAGCTHAWHLFTIRSPHRDALQKHLTHHNIQTGIHYPIPLHLQPAYQHRNLKGHYPVAEETALHTLSLPMYPQLPTTDVHRVIDALHTYFK